jgi:hypothetical protein
LDVVLSVATTRIGGTADSDSNTATATSVEEQVRKILESDPEYATHTARIMVDHFGVKEEDLAPKFKDWKNMKDVTLWRKIRNALLSLEAQGLVKKQRHEKINYYHWIKK